MAERKPHETIDLVESLRKQGLSCTEIAQKTKLSKNTIISK